MRKTAPTLLLGVLTACTRPTPSPVSPSSCPLASRSVSELAAWRSDGFKTPSPDQTAAELAACLGDPDPFLRDTIGYEGLTAVLRLGAVSKAARRELIASLSDVVRTHDPAGFQ
ncbi:MAG: hypothetical protein AAFX94_06455 [Myxococcota bacterium]